MSFQSILVLVIIFVLLGVAIGFIANSEKGWHGGCTGNCASCQEHCNDKQKRTRPSSSDVQDRRRPPYDCCSTIRRSAPCRAPAH